MTGWQLMPGYEFWTYVADEETARRLADAWAVMGLVISRREVADELTAHWAVSAVGGDDDRMEPARFEAICGVCRDITGEDPGGESTLMLIGEAP